MSGADADRARRSDDRSVGAVDDQIVPQQQSQSTGRSTTSGNTTTFYDSRDRDDDGDDARSNGNPDYANTSGT